MTKNKNQNILYTQTRKRYMVMQCINFFQQVDSNGWILKSLTQVNITSNSSKGCVLEVGLEYPKELQELYNDYPLALDKIEIKREILSEYQLKIADLYNIPIGNVKKLVSNFFDKEKYVLHYKNQQLYLRLEIKTKKNIAFYNSIIGNV